MSIDWARVDTNPWWTTRRSSPFVLRMETLVLPASCARFSGVSFGRRSARLTLYWLINLDARNNAVFASDSAAVGWFPRSQHLRMRSIMWSATLQVAVVGSVTGTLITVAFCRGTFLDFLLGVLCSTSALLVKKTKPSRPRCRLRDMTSRLIQAKNL